MTNLIKYLVTAVLITVGSNVSAGTTFECKPTIFGLCKTVYTGTTTIEDSKKYVQDAKLATEWIVMNIEGVKSARFFLGKAAIVLQRKEGYTIGGKSLSRIQKEVADRGLWIVHVMEVTNDGRRTVLSYRGVYDKGGKSRYFALQRANAP